MNLRSLGLKTWRSIAGRNTKLERYLRGRHRVARQNQVSRLDGDGFTQISGESFVVIRSTRDPEPKRGILLKGGCDLPSVFVAGRLIREDIRGSVAIFRQGTPGELGSHRSDQILQTLNTIPEEHVAEAVSMLRLGPDYFSPRLFTDTEFSITAPHPLPKFPKTVVVLSIGSDLVRTVYRHKELGYMVDPGGFWLNQLTDKVIPDPEIAKWFKSNFVNAGRISVEDFRDNYDRIATLVKQNTGAHLIVFNTLVVDPLNPTYNYHLGRDSQAIRRREFNIALKELSAKHGFHILDVDRILKNQGVRGQVDFAHFPVEKMEPIGREAFRILKELEVV